MEEVLATTAVAIAAFVSTNVDNLFILIGFLSAPGQRAWAVFTGFVAAFIAILLLGFAASIGADFAPGRYASMLGVIPIAFGMFGLVGLLRGAAPEGAVAPPTATGTIAVAGVTLANGSDSLAVFVSLLAETDDPFSYLVVGVAGLLALVWCGLAHWMVRHDTLGALLERVAPRILPFVLIAVGVYILLDTNTDTWLPAPGGWRGRGS